MRFQEAGESTPSQLDFIPRERRGQIGKLILAFLLTVAFISVFMFTLGQTGGLFVPLLTAFLMTALGAYVVIRNQQLLDLVMATEFQNLLFAQSLGIGYAFSIIVKRDGTILYVNDGLREQFAQQDFSESRALDKVFMSGNVAGPDRERVLGSIYNMTADHLMLAITDAKGVPREFMLTVEPLHRPPGYLLLRGRQFTDTRTGFQQLPEGLRAAPAEKFDHLLRTTPVALYLCDPFGKIEYANTAFESITGQRVRGGAVTVASILAEIGGREVQDDYTVSEYAGEVTLRVSGGGNLPGLLFQSLLRDESGKVVGASGSIMAARQGSQTP